MIINNINMQKYNIIYADPPWTYKDKAKAGNRGAECKYPVMTQKELKNLPIDKVADDNCVLFLWVTMPMLQEAFEVIKAWEFEYKTCGFTWVKLNKDGTTPSTGMGYWTRANAELCLLARKGKIKRVRKDIKQIVLSPRRKHSQKPDEIRDRIVELMGDLPRLELFGRKQIEGWDVIGYDIDGKDIKEGLNELIKQFEQK